MPEREQPGNERTMTFRIRLVDVEKGEERPDVAVYALDRNREVIHVAQVDVEGNTELPDEIFEKAAFISLAPADEEFGRLERKQVLTYRAGRFREIIADDRVINVPQRDWKVWLPILRCVSGSVSRCHLHWPFLTDLVQAVAEIKPLERSAAVRTLATSAVAERIAQPAGAIVRDTSRLTLTPGIHIPFFHCHTVCDGIVEVYRRTCCCEPWIVYDPRLDDVLERLDDLILPEIPDLPVPPFPEPDPPPWVIEELPFVKGGALDQRALQARRDRDAILRLSPVERAEYIRARPYLFCTCGPATKVASGHIRPDGSFSICWADFHSVYSPHCHTTYAYKVKQNIGGATVTIYDGVAAGQWFDYDDEANLVSYHPQAISCRHNDFPGEGAFALLQDIGETESHQLKTPDAAGWDRVNAPTTNSGLVDAKGITNRNWGGTLKLRYHFSESMRGIGARYYRISVTRADSSGNPVGDRTYLDEGLSWKYYEMDGININVESEALGPFTVSGTQHLYKIPYDADRDWQSGEYHGFLRTGNFPHGRHLVTLEVFDASGNRLRPTGAGGPGTDAAFTFRRWYQETGPTANVPYAALTHMFWWDNRNADAKIVDLRRNGVESEEECQFLEGPGGTQFSVGYRAYHPEAKFFHRHSLWWRRGLGGPTGYLEHNNPNNVGSATTVGESTSATFAAMLGDEPKCSFSLHLDVSIKTFDGIYSLGGRHDTAAFALENTSA